MTKTASGSFEVQTRPLPLDGAAEGSMLGRLSLDKKFSGELEGIGQGEMLTAMTAVQGSAGYVAIERVTGTIEGRQGSFVLQHAGTMAHGDQQLAIVVVPDSGTGDLTGIGGQLTIRIAEGKHFYEFHYDLPALPPLPPLPDESS